MVCFGTHGKFVHVSCFSAHNRSLLAIRAILPSRHLTGGQLIFKCLDSRERTLLKVLWFCPLSSKSRCFEKRLCDPLLANRRFFKLIAQGPLACRRALFHEFRQRHAATYFGFLEQVL